MAIIISYIGSCTFGIYLISDLLIHFEQPIYNKLGILLNPLPAVVLFGIVVFISGLLITSILKKVPAIKKVL